MNIYGASGHGKVVIDIALSNEICIHNIIDDNKELKSVSGYLVKHEITDEILINTSVIAIGENSIRKKVVENFKGIFSKAISHASAVISGSVNLGVGTVVMANASVNRDAIVGEHCIINTGATVEHDCRLGNFVHISPNAAIAGNVEVGEGSQIGIGAVVIPGVKIGEWVTIGAGAVVIEDVPDAAVVVGNPGRILKYKKL